MKAPAEADSGPAETGAVDWLFLTDKGGTYKSIGLSQVYRVVTSGGVGPTCLGTGIEIGAAICKMFYHSAVQARG